MSNTIKFSQHKGPQNQNPPQAHSGIGIASFVLSLILFPAWIILFFYAGYVQVSAQEYGADMSQEVAATIGLFFFVLFWQSIFCHYYWALLVAYKRKTKNFLPFWAWFFPFLPLHW